MNTNNMNLTNPPAAATLPSSRVQPLLRSVQITRSSSTGFGGVAPVVERRRCVSHEPMPTCPLMKALKANKEEEEADVQQPAILEEYLQDYLRWANQQSVALLPQVSDEQPLMPTNVSLPQDAVPLSKIMDAIATSLLNCKDKKGVVFCFRPSDCPGRIEICSCSTSGPCKLKFVVQLWRSKEDIVVELQRRRGCPVWMHQFRRPLFQALHKLAKDTQEATTKVSPAMKVVAAAQKACQSLQLPKPRVRCIRPLHFPPPLRLNFA